MIAETSKSIIMHVCAWTARRNQQWWLQKYNNPFGVFYACPKIISCDHVSPRQCQQVEPWARWDPEVGWPTVAARSGQSGCGHTLAGTCMGQQHMERVGWNNNLHLGTTPWIITGLVGKNHCTSSGTAKTPLVCRDCEDNQGVLAFSFAFWTHNLLYAIMWRLGSMHDQLTYMLWIWGIDSWLRNAKSWTNFPFKPQNIQCMQTRQCELIMSMDQQICTPALNALASHWSFFMRGGCL